MSISLKTDMQMLGLSTPKMFSLFLRVMACCLLSLGDLTSEGGSAVGGASRVWERAGSRGRGTCQISRDSRDNCLGLVHLAIPPQALRFCEVGARLPGTGDRDKGKAKGTLLRMLTDILASALRMVDSLLSPGAPASLLKLVSANLRVTMET